MFSWLTLLVISLINTGATRFERSFLCTHRKLISTISCWLQVKEREGSLCLINNPFITGATIVQSVLFGYTCQNIPYSWKLSREKTFANSHKTLTFVKVFSLQTLLLHGTSGRCSTSGAHSLHDHVFLLLHAYTVYVDEKKNNDRLFLG